MTSIDSQQLPDVMDVSGTLLAPRIEDFDDAVIDPGQVTDAIQVLVGAYTGKAVDDRIILYFNGDNHITFAYLMVNRDNLELDIAFTIAKSPFIDGNSGVDVYYLVQRANGSSESSEVLPVTIQDQHHLVREFVDFEDLEPHGWEGERIEQSEGSFALAGVDYIMTPGIGPTSKCVTKWFENLKSGGAYRVSSNMSYTTLTGGSYHCYFEALIGDSGWGDIAPRKSMGPGQTSHSAVFVAGDRNGLRLIVSAAEFGDSIADGYFDDILLELVE